MLDPLTSPCIVELPSGVLLCRATGRTFRGDRQPIYCCNAVLADLDAEIDADLLELGVVVESDEQRYSLWSKWRAAIRKWKAAGKPVRKPEEIQACLSICKTCDQYSTRLGFSYCQSCGCHVNGLMIGELNKIRMQTESCPKGKWK